MLPWGIIRAVFVGFLALAACSPALGHAAKDKPDDTPAKAPEVGWADGEQAFAWVQGWVRDSDGVPKDAALPKRAVTSLFGVYVTLRENGAVVGRGQALREDAGKTIDQPGPPVELAPLLAAATRQALKDFDDKLIQEALKLKIKDKDILRDARIARRQRVQVDIQLGHNLESIVVPADSKPAALVLAFAPGFHGLRLAGTFKASASYIWPATELAYNTQPPRLLFRLLKDQGYQPSDLPSIAKTNGPAMQRFDIIHVVRPRQAQPMRRLTRGNLILQQQAIDQRTIAGLAERAARYLDRLIVIDAKTKRIGVRGTYQPSMKRYAPEWANFRETALLCYALNRHARIAINADQGGETVRARVKRVLRLAEQITPSALPKDKPPKHLTVAFLLLAMCESPIALDKKQTALRDALAKLLFDLKHPDGGGYRIQKDSEKQLSRASAAVITYALAAWHQKTKDKDFAAPIWSVIADLMKENIKDPRVNDLLWVNHTLVNAGPALAKAQPDPDKAAKQLKAWQDKLAEYLAKLCQQQLRGKPVLGPEDVIGGFMLKKAPPGSPPNPSWESAIPLAYLAIGIRDQAIVPEDKVLSRVVTAGLGARFIGQLMITEPSAYYIRDPKSALGGVRNRLWDNTLYPDCTSMSLIALAELQHSLSTVAAPKDD